MSTTKRLGYSLAALAAVATTAWAGQLADSGQTTCYNTSGATDCSTDSSFPRQDGSLGAPLTYTKLDAAGNPLNASTTAWACVRDEATGLVWENKTADSGMQGVAHRYAWSNIDASTNGGDSGGTTESSWCGETLNGQACTTENYVIAVNAQHLCGSADWRLPTQRELLTLVHAGRNNPTIDAAFFPHTANDVYWAANNYALIPAFAWGVNFAYGAANADYKSRPYRVRLVHGAPF